MARKLSIPLDSRLVEGVVKFFAGRFRFIVRILDKLIIDSANRKKVRNVIIFLLLFIALTFLIMGILLCSYYKLIAP